MRTGLLGRPVFCLAASIHVWRPLARTVEIMQSIYGMEACRIRAKQKTTSVRDAVSGSEDQNEYPTLTAALTRSLSVKFPNEPEASPN
ncbi:hypothetical protein SAMN03159448_05200 [Sinorhizobium sp. NFACC03]|nr:hypothetical protein SAMN03159448_05200 [Sinorhizobium sp. NFACC03]